MFEQWIMTSWPKAGFVVVSAAGIYAAVILCTRLSGLRSFSKMSSFDLAMTFAIGSLIATTLVSRNPPLLQGVVAVASLFLLQFIVALLRRVWSPATRIVDNEPVLLMLGSQILHRNLSRARITEDDLFAKLREANVLDLAQVRAVVLETTGDMSVLHSGDHDQPLDMRLLRGVRRAEEDESLTAERRRSVPSSAADQHRQSAVAVQGPLPAQSHRPA